MTQGVDIMSRLVGSRKQRQEVSVLERAHEECIREAVFPYRNVPDPSVRIKVALVALKEQFSQEKFTEGLIRDFLQRDLRRAPRGVLQSA